MPCRGLLSPRREHGEGAANLRHGVTKRRPGPERRRRAGLRPSRDEKAEAEAGKGSGPSARPGRAACALRTPRGSQPERRPPAGGAGALRYRWAPRSAPGPVLSRPPHLGRCRAAPALRLPFRSPWWARRPARLVVASADPARATLPRSGPGRAAGASAVPFPAGARGPHCAFSPSFSGAGMVPGGALGLPCLTEAKLASFDGSSAAEQQPSSSALSLAKPPSGLLCALLQGAAGPGLAGPGRLRWLEAAPPALEAHEPGGCSGLAGGAQHTVGSGALPAPPAAAVSPWGCDREPAAAPALQQRR